MKRAIVTGANGFIGSNLVAELLKRNYEVYAVVRNEKSDVAGLPKNHSRLHIVFCELKNILLLNQLIDERQIDIFFHFAWEGTAGIARTDERIQLQNVQYACDSVKVAGEMGVKKYIYAGSIMEYEAYVNVKNSERKIVSNYMYSIAKLTANQMCKVLAYNLGIEYYNLLLSNVYGVGENSKRFINVTLDKIIRGEKLSFSTASQMYDFIYITDAVEAIVTVAECGNGRSEYYIGNREQRPLREYIYIIINTTSPAINYSFGEMQSNEIHLTYKEFDTERIYREFCFEPQIGFEEGIRRTYQYMQERSKEKKGK